MRTIGAGNKLRWYPVDHSIYGAAAFAVETSAGWVAYTGDLRLHGKRGEQTRQAVAAMAALKPTVLLCEGTRGADGTDATEEGVHDTALEIVQQAAGKLVFADFGPRNVERLLIFHEIAQATGRRLAVLNKDAYLLEAMHFAAPAEVPHFGSVPGFALYQKGRARLSGWETETLGYATVLCSWMRQRCGAIPATTSSASRFGTSTSWPAWRRCRRSTSTPAARLSTRKCRWTSERLRNWLEHFDVEVHGLGETQDSPLHASGHASGSELVDIIRQVNPQTLVPIHTQNPQYFLDSLANDGIEVVLPELERPLHI